MTETKKKSPFLSRAYSLESNRNTLAFYEDWAEVYDKELVENEYQQPLRCAQALEMLTPHRDGLILDIGCGTGLSGLALNKAGYTNIEGCDFSRPMLEKATQLNIYSRLFYADLNKPPIEIVDECYDAITVVGVFSFGHVRADAMDEILRVAKPGAPIIIGLNEHFYAEGSLTSKLADLEKGGNLKTLSQKHGDHIRGTDTKGWVLSLQKL